MKPVKPAKAVTATGFKFVGGALCLDFVNTVGTRGSSDLREKIVDFTHLVFWSELAGILSRPEAAALLKRAAVEPRTAESVLAHAIDMREVLYRVFKSSIEGVSPQKADLLSLNREVAIARARETIIHSGSAFRWQWNDSRALDHMLCPVISSAAELLTSPALSQVRRCADQECGWLFLDTSRNRSRHWCDMRDCGNRAKVARFRERLRQ